MKRLLLCLCILFISSSHSSNRPLGHKALKRKALLLKREIDTLGKRMESEQERLISTIEGKRSLLTTLEKEEDSLKQWERYLRALERKSLKIKREFLVLAMTPEETRGLVEKEALKKQVRRTLKRIKVAQTRAQNKKALIQESLERLKLFIKREQELSRLIESLESRKSQQLNYYVKVLGKRNKALAVIKRKKSRLRFLSPFKVFTGAKRENKGLRYWWKGNKATIRSSERGEVAYKGRLAHLGQVMIIEHPRSMHSVYIGRINSKLRKGQKVKKGQALGKALRNEGQGLYFELRGKKGPYRNLPYKRSVLLTLRPPLRKI